MKECLHQSYINFHNFSSRRGLQIQLNNYMSPLNDRYCHICTSVLWVLGVFFARGYFKCLPFLKNDPIALILLKLFLNLWILQACWKKFICTLVIILCYFHWLLQEGRTTEFSRAQFCPNVGLNLKLSSRKLPIEATVLEISPKFDHLGVNFLSWVNLYTIVKVQKGL